MSLRFEWDPDKARTNLSKHGVSFEEASTVFQDPFELTVPDAGHSEDEDRWLSIALSAHHRLLVVSYVQQGATIRLISARLAVGLERRHYEEDEDQ